MIKITNPTDCCGCEACVQRCPKACISMHEDEEGFMYPIVDESVCVDCGACERACPLINRAEPIPPVKVYAAKNKNEDERMSSSSGGIFILLAKAVLAKGGVVFGAVYDDEWQVVIRYAETLEDVLPMMGSKYVQSRTDTAFRDAERFLKQGREVLFTGAPCQIAGFRTFLRKDYPNLLAVDYLCHGAPSPGVWRRYLEEARVSHSARRAAAGKNTVSLSLNGLPLIKGIAFRDKQYGWKKFGFALTFTEPTGDGENSVLLSHKCQIFNENPYMRGFLADVYLRPSCYECRCKNGVNHSDLTIGDFWGIDRLMPEFDDDRGVSIVVVSTDKGFEYFNALPVEVRDANISDAKATNGGFKERLRIHPKRELFYKRFRSRRCTVEQNVKNVLTTPPVKKILQFTKKIIKSIIKGVLGDKGVDAVKAILKKK